MTDIATTKDRILRVISAICTDGFTAGWQPSRRGFETRERFFFDSSLRMQKMTDCAETFAIHIEIQRVDGTPASKNLPDACDWSLNAIVEFAQQLDDDEVADLPAPQIRRKAVKTMSDMLDAIDNGEWTTVAGTRYRAVINTANDPEHEEIIIVTDGDDPMDDKWGAERFLEQGRE